MRAILSVTVRERYTVTHYPNEPRILYHSRRGLTPDRSKATRFKTLDYAVKAARQRYSPRLVYLHTPPELYPSRDLQGWSVTTIEESQP